MFNKVLIANRGAIATRIIRTLKKLNVTSIAVYAEADADSLHVQQADEAYSLGDGNAAETYLNQEKLIAIIHQSGAEAVHPGYGFLSENPSFVERLEKIGVVFLGPTTAQMETFGLKHTARAVAKTAGVPLLPGTDLIADLTAAITAAEQIGYPVMLKSTAGGGGIGMQRCYSAEELSLAFESVKRLSANNFANDGVFLEKFIENARHIEVQIFGDGKGGAIALGERDCSSQRRNQKVIEEAPAPNLSEALRAQLHDVAVKLVQTVNYRNAGTVEFVYDQQAEKFYFLEVNTRLQVEHGVTEEIFNIDLVEWMVKLGCNELTELSALQKDLNPQGHAIQVRIYAEDPHKSFQPCAGLLSHVQLPQGAGIRIEHWIEAGVEVTPLYDPLLAKVIIKADTREQAIEKLARALSDLSIYGIETNTNYVRTVLQTDLFQQGRIHTRYLNDFKYAPNTIDVISPGTMTSIQDYPGREGYWNIGVPPSGPFDDWSFRLGNRLLNNEPTAAGLEITLNGPTLRFNRAMTLVLTGAKFAVTLNDHGVDFWQPFSVHSGDTLKIGKVANAGARAYLLVQGGLWCPDYLGSKSTFTLGQFGGHAGRALRVGDVLHLPEVNNITQSPTSMPSALQPTITREWDLHVIYGPHGAPDFFTPKDITTFFAHQWEVHYNSSRTGVRLVGPKPEWARTDGGEAGMHPSNLHDNAYALGTVDFTGDMPVVLGPDGPSLGGFVCPATVVKAERWKLGQLKAGDKIRFHPVTHQTAVELEKAYEQSLEQLIPLANNMSHVIEETTLTSPIIRRLPAVVDRPEVIYRPSGDKYLLAEYGDLVLDINLRFRVHALMLALQQQNILGLKELTPGIRSLQIHYDSLQLSQETLLNLLEETEKKLGDIDQLTVPARVVHLPLSWNDSACTQAVEKYMQSVRKDAPWCPSNLEFIRRINGLDTVAQVKEIVFNANYVVMGLGDVYLGAPVATPLDPRHRLVTTKYNPARTWTAENSVGIGGSYLCVYGMEGPGGYQFVGRTLQMWNRYRQTQEFTQPWLLRFFDQIKFFEVSHDELLQIRRDFPKGMYPLKIEESAFSLKQYNDYLTANKLAIEDFTQQRQTAFDAELKRWVESGQINFESGQDIANDIGAEEILADNCVAIESHVAGNIWKVLVKPGDVIQEGQPLVIIESMKMEIDVVSPVSGVVTTVVKGEGSQVAAGQRLLVLTLALEEN